MKLQGGDWFLYIVYIFVGAIGIYLAAYILFSIHGAAPQIFNQTSNPAGAQTYTNGTNAVNYLQTLLLFVFVGAMLASAISGSQVDTVPAFAFVGIIVLVVGLVTTVVFHNIYFDMIQNSVFGGFAPPSTTLLMFQFYSLLCLIAFFVVMIFTYGHGGGGQGAYNR